MDKGTAYTAGIMHDVGGAASAVIQPEPYARFLQSVQDEPLEILHREQELLEVDHCEVGGCLAADWKLPQELINIVSSHHTVQGGGEFDLLAVIRLGCRMADAIGFPAAPSLKCRSYKELTDGLIEQVRSVFPAEYEDLSFRIAIKINSIESAY